MGAAAVAIAVVLAVALEAAFVVMVVAAENIMMMERWRRWCVGALSEGYIHNVPLPRVLPTKMTSTCKLPTKKTSTCESLP
jgi:hypothetical protein